MSISTYSELVAALDGVTGYLHRADLTAKIPDFVRIAESRINRKLSTLQQETEATLTATVGSRLMAQPTRMNAPIALWLTTYLPRIELEYMLPERMPVTTWNSQSDYYTVDGSNIATENPADQAYTYTLRYIDEFDLAATSTNVVLTNYPDVYLYGTLAASVPYTQNVNMLPMWSELYDQAMREAMTDSTQTRSTAKLRTEFSNGRTNILRGF